MNRLALGNDHNKFHLRPVHAHSPPYAFIRSRFLTTLSKLSATRKFVVKLLCSAPFNKVTEANEFKIPK